MAATAAEMYETAATAYERLCAPDTPTRTTSFDLVYASTLLFWGLRLEHVGRADESAMRLRRSAAITRRWLDHHPGDPCSAAALALALAKLGEVVEGGEAGARGDHAAAAGRELPVRPDGAPGPRHQPPRTG